MFSKGIIRLSAVAFVVLLIGGLTLSLFVGNGQTSTSNRAIAEDECLAFDTGYKVCGRFLEYWRQNGGLAQQGLPVTPVIEEKQPLAPYGDGKTYKVQYFERARFELHPLNKPPYDVLLGLVGRESFKTRYGEIDSSAQLLSVMGKRTDDKVGTFQAGTGNSYFIINLMAVNTTTKQLIVSPASITIRTASGKDYNVSEATYQLPKFLKYTELQYIGRVDGELVYEIPVNEKIVSVTMDYFDDKITVNVY